MRTISVENIKRDYKTRAHYDRFVLDIVETVRNGCGENGTILLTTTDVDARNDKNHLIKIDLALIKYVRNRYRTLIILMKKIFETN